MLCFINRLVDIFFNQWLDDIVSNGFSLQYLSDYEKYIKWQYTLLSFSNISISITIFCLCNKKEVVGN